MPEIESQFQPLPRAPQPGVPDSGQVRDAAFELGPFGAINRLWNRERFAPDENFSLRDVYDDQNPLHARYRSAFAGARSLAEFQAKEDEIKFMEQQRSILDRGGVSGVAWLLANELLSPANLIPVAGVSGGLLRSAARVGGTVGASVIAEEVVQQAADPTRTNVESVINVGAATILGGILGGAIRYMTPRTLTEEIEHIRAVREITSSVGAARAPGADLQSSGYVDRVGTFGAWLGRQVSPTFMMLDMQRRAGPDALQSVAAFAEAMGISGVTTAGTRQADPTSALGLNIPQARGGTLVAQRDGLENYFAGRIEKIVQDAYTEMALGRKIPPVPGAGTLARTFGRNASMTQTQFREALLDAMNKVEPHPDKYINQAVTQLRKDVLDPIADFLVDTGVLKQEQIDSVREKFGVYYPFMYDHTRVVQDVVTTPEGRRVSFVQSVGEWAARSMREDWEKRRAKALAKGEDFNQLADDLELPTEEANALETSLRAEMEGMSTGEWAQKQEAIRLLREEAEELEKSVKGNLGPDGDAIRAEARRLKQQVKDMHAADPSIAAGKAKKAQLQRRLSNLNLRFERVLGKRVQKLRRIATLEAENVNSLMRLSKTLENYRKNWERWTPEVRAKKRVALANMFAKADAVYETGEARIAKLLEDMPELRTGEEDEVVTRLQRQREEIFGDFMTERGPKGEKMLRITNEDERRAVLDRIDSVLEEGEYKVAKSEKLFNNADFERNLSQLKPARAGLGDIPPDDAVESPLNRAEYPYVLFTPVKAKFQSALIEAVNKAHAAAKPRTVRISELVTDQEAVGKSKIISPSNEQPFAEEINGVLHLRDGNHRVVAAALRGEEFIEVRVAKMDEAIKASGQDISKVKLPAPTQEFDFVPLTPQLRSGLTRFGQMVERADLSDLDALAKGWDDLGKLARTQEARADRLTDISARLEAFDLEDTEEAIALIVEAMDTAARRSAKTVAGRAARAARLEEQLANNPKLKPELSEGYAKNFRGKAQRVDADFREWAAARGVDDAYSDAANFQAAGERYAREYRDFITSDPVRVPDIGWTSGEGNFVLSRLDIPYEVRAPFLVRDPIVSLRRYVRGVVPQGLLNKRLGNIGANEILDGKFGKFAEEYDTRVKTITEDVSLTDAQRQDRLLKLHENYEKSKRTAAYLVRQMRHQVGLGTEPNHWLNRAGAVIMDWNVLRLMGNVVPSSVPDLMRSVMKFGVRDAFKGYTETFSNWAETAKLGDQFGIATDPWNQARLMQIADLEDIPYDRSRFEELVHAAATSMGKVNMSDYWNRWAKTSLMPIINARFMNALETVMTGAAKTPRKEAVELLAQAGIDDDLAGRIWTQLQRQAEIHNGDAGRLMRNNNGTLLPNLEDWNDLDAKLALTAWVNREVRSTIITPDFTDIPMWMKEIPAARLIMQFRSFGMASTTKTLLAGVQQRDAAVLAGVMGMLGMGAVSYYAWAATYGPERLQEALNDPWEKVLDEAIIRSGLLAVLGDALLMGQAVPGLGDWLDFGDQRTAQAGARTSRFLEDGLLGPSLGLLQSAQRIAAGVGGEDGPTTSTTNAFRQLVFYQNVFYLRYLLTQVKDSADETLGVQEPSR